MYYRARYYYPGFARFMQKDPLGLAAGINPYAYVGNSPTNYRDPSGMIAAPAFKSANRDWLAADLNYTSGKNVAGGLEAGQQSLALVACGPGCVIGRAIAPRLPGIPGFPGQVQQRPELGGDEAQLGLPSSPPPSTGWVQRAVDFVRIQPQQFIENFWGLIFNEEGNSDLPSDSASPADKAKELGYDRKVKDPPFNSHGQPVFTNGKDFITPDADKHNGGEWKGFDRRGERTGTYDGNLDRIGK